MKKKIFISLGLMSGTSMDGVDLSLIKSDGNNYIEYIDDKYYEFSDKLRAQLIDLRDAQKNAQDLLKNQSKIKEAEKNFTLFNSKIVNSFINDIGIKPDLIGFHGQTIFHSAKEKISRQLGNAKLLSQLTNCSIVNNFREQDLINNGQGAPLTPIFHFLISRKIKDEFKLEFPINIINLGGIANSTSIINNLDIENDVYAYDIAPGNCLLDEWFRKHTDKRYDSDGKVANFGKVNDLILNQAIDNFEITSIKESLDVKDFDTSFVKGLSFEDGCATLTEFTAHLISEGIKKVDEMNNIFSKNLIFCGGGRKNKTLINNISKLLNNKDINIYNIDKFKINGDFVESKAFAYLAIRSLLNLPISFPNTTRCSSSSSGGILTKNF